MITLEAINGQTGESLAREQAEAESREQVLRALSRVATQLREKLGESLSSIQRFDKPWKGRWNRPRLQSWRRSRPGLWPLSIRTAAGRWKRFRFTNAQWSLTQTSPMPMPCCLRCIRDTGRPGLAAEYAEKGYALEGSGERVREAPHHEFLSWLCHWRPEQADRSVDAAEANVPARNGNGPATWP